MDWFYTGMSDMHATLAWCSVLLFAARGLAVQFGIAQLDEWATDSRVLLLIFGVNMLLAVSGLSLLALLYSAPQRESWLMLKLLVIAAYALCAHWALGHGPLHWPAYLAALALLAYALALSFTRAPLLGF